MIPKSMPRTRSGVGTGFSEKIMRHQKCRTTPKVNVRSKESKLAVRNNVSAAIRNFLFRICLSFAIFSSIRFIMIILSA